MAWKKQPHADHLSAPNGEQAADDRGRTVRHGLLTFPATVLALLVALWTTQAPSFAANAAGQASTSGWWAGYVSTSPPSDAAISSRVQLPTVSCSQTSQLSMWAGYDGWYNNDVEQDGATAYCPSAGAPAQFSLWYELYDQRELPGQPDAIWGNPGPITINGSFHPAAGDYVNMFVSHYSAGRSIHNVTAANAIFFSLEVVAPNDHKLFSWSHTILEPILYDAPFAYSECIAEAPGAAYYPLVNFGSVTFTNCSAIDDAPNDANLMVVNMVGKYGTMATVGPVTRNSNGENSFVVSQPSPSTTTGTSGGGTGTGGTTPTTGGGSSGPASIQIAWSSSYPGWVTMDLTGFNPGSYSYTCDFSSGGDTSYTLYVPSTSYVTDNGKTCYDLQSGDVIWVTIGSVTSNQLTVNAQVPLPLPVTVTTGPVPTWPETPGSVVHTWTDYADAGGAEGSSIPSEQTVDVSCKVQGFAVADGDTWWYRISSAPWDNQYYGSADAFYNNGHTGGSLIGTPFVDPNVPDC